MTTEQKQILVIGAGIIGASIAFHLAKENNKVTIVDAKTPCAGASGASDGAVSIASKRTDIAIRLAKESKAYYELLSQSGQVLEGIYQQRETDFIVTNDKEQIVINKHLEKLSSHGVDIEQIENKQLKSRYPFLTTKVQSIYKIYDEGHTLAYEVVNKFLESSSNITIMANTQVTKLILSDDKNTAVGVETNNGQLFADEIIIANGLGVNDLLPELKIIANKGLLIVTDRICNRRAFDSSLMFASYLIEKHQFGSSEKNNQGALVIDPLESGQLLIGSTREYNARADITELQSISNILRKALKYFPALENIDVIRIFAGIRAATPDHLPYVGPVKKHKNLWVASGFEGDGICLAPLIGRELANWIQGKAVNEYLKQLTPERAMVSNV